MANLKERIVIEAVDNTTRGFRSAQAKMNAFDRTLKRVQTTLLGFVGINIGIQLAKGLVRASDAAVELEAKLRLMTDGTEDFNTAQAELVKISKESGSALDSNIILFTRMNRAIQASGGTMQTTLGVTRALSQGLRISGASAQESASVVRQFSQAMASGVLRGEEFNAIMENGGRIGLALAAGLDVPIGKLREMAKAGELTAQRVTAALLSQSEKLAAENAKLPLTIGRAFQNVRTEWTLLLSTFSSGNTTIANVINGLAENVGAFTRVLIVATKVAGLFLGAKFIASVVDYAKSIRRTITDVVALSAQKGAAARQDQLNSNIEKSNIEKIALARSRSLSQIAAQRIQLAQTNLESAKTAAITTSNTLAENELALVRQKASIQDTNDIIKKRQKGVVAQRAVLKEMEAEVQLEIVRGRAQISAKGALAHEVRLAATRQQVSAASKVLSASEAELALAHSAGTKAIATQNTLYVENAAIKAKVTATNGRLIASELALANAQKASLASSAASTFVYAGATKKLGLFTRILEAVPKIIKGVVSAIGRLASGLLGLPGLLIFLGASIASEFVALDVIFASLVAAVAKLVLILTNPIDFVFNTGDLQSKLDGVTARYNRYIDDKIGIDDAEKARILARDQSLIAELQKTQTQIIENASRTKDAESAINELRTDSFTKMIDSMQSESERLKVDNSAQIAAIEEESSAQALALQSRLDNEVDFQSALQELRDTTDAKVQAQTLGFLEAEKTRWESFYNAQIKGAEGNNRKQLALQIELGDKLRGINSDAVTTLQSRLSKMRKEYADFAKNIKSIQDDIADNEKRTADFIREIRGDQRADYQKDLDAQSERYAAIKLLDEAATLDKETQAGEIVTLNKKAMSQLEDVIRTENARKQAAEDGSVAQLTAVANIDAALVSYTRASDAVASSQKDILAREGTAQERRAADIKSSADQLLDYEKLITKIDKQLKGRRELLITINDDEVVRKLDALERRLTKLKNTQITLTTREEKLSTVTESIQKKATGGFIKRKDRVPGSGNGDTVKALLTPGEFIMRKSAVQKFGAATMHAMNNGVASVRKYATGGLVEDDDPFAAFLKNRSKTKKSFTPEAIANNAPKASEMAKALAAQYNLRKGRVETRLAGTSGAGYEVGASIIHMKSWIRQLNGMVTSVRALSGGSISDLSKVAAINSEINRTLKQQGRAGKSYTRGFDFFGKLRGLLQQRNSISGGSELFEMGSGGTDKSSTATNELTSKQRSDNLVNAKKAGISEVFARNLTTRGIAIPTDKEALDKLLTKEKIRKFATGGSVGGSGLGDTVRALLTPGEFVMRKSTVQSFGQDFFNNLNKGIMPQRFATGGAVGESANVETININFNVDGQQATGRFTKDDATMRMLESLQQSGAAA